LLDIIYSYVRFCDNEIILQLLLYYKNKKAISTLDLHQQISIEKYKILTNTKYSHNINKYLINEFNKNDININIVKYLVEHGVDINEETLYDITPIFEACSSWNETLVKYLVEHGVDINKGYNDNETLLIKACEDGNLELVKYLVEHGADTNKENIYKETPLIKACEDGNLELVKYLVNMEQI